MNLGHHDDAIVPNITSTWAIVGNQKKVDHIFDSFPSAAACGKSLFRPVGPVTID
jgi:hypothetical protein